MNCLSAKNNPWMHFAPKIYVFSTEAIWDVAKM